MSVLDIHQIEAVNKMKNGCILCGGVGSGKSRTALAYYYIRNGGKLDSGRDYVKMKNPKNLYIITTAQKRDKHEWEGEFCHFRIDSKDLYENTITIDSWNNVPKYASVRDSFFIFDEQRVVGYGAWVKAFLKIAKANEWILLSATPGDKWMDYIPVFIANGFYKNKTEFTVNHVIYSRFAKFPQVERYTNEKRLRELRDSILVDIECHRNTVPHHETVYTEYDRILYKSLMKDRWNVWENKPIENASEFCMGLRRIVNSDESRQEALLDIQKKHDRIIVFYNFDFELDILRSLSYTEDTVVAEWNGHNHQPIPKTKKWVYLVQYTAGSEGWNCIETDTIVFYSQNYSYRIMVQASGRIDRRNTPYTDLYYYHLKSHASIDLAIARALESKKKFNESGFTSKYISFQKVQ